MVEFFVRSVVRRGSTCMVASILGLVQLFSGWLGTLGTSLSITPVISVTWNLGSGLHLYMDLLGKLTLALVKSAAVCLY